MTNGDDKLDDGMWGLTKREYFAAMAMQGLVSKGVPPDWYDSKVRVSWSEWVGEMSCEMADELIKGLNNQK